MRRIVTKKPSMSFAAVHPYTFCPRIECGEQIVISALSQPRKQFDGSSWQITCPHCDGIFQVKDADMLYAVFAWDEKQGKLRQAPLADQFDAK